MFLANKFPFPQILAVVVKFQVPVVVDHNGCNGNADINFRFTGLV